MRLKNKIIVLFKYKFINGSFIDSLEYYIYLRKYLKNNINYYLVDGCTKDIILTIINSRYIGLDVNDIMDGIKFVKKIDILKEQNTNLILFDYTTIHDLYHFICHNNILVCSNISDEFLHNHAKLTDYDILGEMPHHYKTINYTYKFLFDHYKPVEECDDKILVSCLTDKPIDYEFYNLNPDKILLKSGSDFFVDDLFSKFNEYVYISTEVFDQKPRLIIESKFYNKNIIYYPKSDGSFDGAYYRFNWILTNDIMDRNFTDEDEVLEWCVRYGNNLRK